MKKIVLLIMAAMMTVGLYARENDSEMEVWIGDLRYALIDSQWSGRVAYVIHADTTGGQQDPQSDP